ncbi:MAG TPA: MoxR family ATPase, partial [Planctomycetaceae bacterium]|nr:MoxR family ATPase [Planctomycetaceae bacterium]
DEEFEIVRQTTAETQATVQKILSRQEVKSLQAIVRKVPVADHVIRYAMQFARLTRRDKGDVPDFIREFVSWGAGPRASQYLILGAKARAVLNGRTYASTDDVRAVAAPVLRHRIITNFNAEAEGVKPDQIVERLMQTIETPHESRGSAFGAKLPRMFKTAEHPNHARG